MNKSTQVSNVVVAKCDDGAFRKILLVECRIENDNAVNAMAKYGQATLYGWYRHNDIGEPLFDRVA